MTYKNTLKFKHRRHQKLDQHNKYNHDEKEEEEQQQQEDDFSEDVVSESLYKDDDDEEPVMDDDVQSESSDGVSEQFSSPTLPNFQNVRDNILFGQNSLLNSPKYSLPITPPNFSNYMNVAPLPIFHGAQEECPMAHLSRFTKVCRANNASSIYTMIKIFPVTLENEASLWYDLNIEPYSSLTWDEIKSSFIEAYYKLDHEDQFRYELTNMNQDDKEPVRSYFLRLQLMLQKWPDHGLSDNILKGVFVDGLKEEFQDWVILQRPSCLDEALRLAFDWEQVQSLRATRRRRKCGFCGGRHEEKECEVKEKMRKLGMKKMSENFSSSEDGEFRVVKQKSQCLCGKHQCWKKRLET